MDALSSLEEGKLGLRCDDGSPRASSSLLLFEIKYVMIWAVVIEENCPFSTERTVPSLLSLTLLHMWHHFLAGVLSQYNHRLIHGVYTAGYL